MLEIDEDNDVYAVIYIAKHKLWAILVCLCVTVYEWQTEGEFSGMVTAKILGLLLVPILFCELFAFFGRFGFWQLFAKDRRDDLAPGVVATFFWILLLIASLMMLFDWWVY